MSFEILIHLHKLLNIVRIWDPNDFATTSAIPSTSQTDLIGPPAMIPVPAGDSHKNFT